MNRLATKKVDAATECAACGGPIIRRFNNCDFCSESCFQTGRAFCRYCDKSLSQSSQHGGFKKSFCNNLCRSRYIHTGKISSRLLDEERRSTCKGCGKPITQPKGGRRLFCTKTCNAIYYRAARYDYSLTDEWGNYAPETRKILIELQSLNLNNTAHHLAKAIDREYRIRRDLEVKRSGIECQCKNCGKKFQRSPWSDLSRDYCSPKCNPVRAQLAIEHGSRTFLTWKQVNEIRNIYFSEQISQKSLARRYGVSALTIRNIVQYKTWKPEHETRPSGKHVEPRGYGENNHKAKLTWEQVNEIRNLYDAKKLAQHELAKKYGVTRTNIARIVHYKIWKPECDPRKAVQGHD